MSAFLEIKKPKSKFLYKLRKLECFGCFQIYVILSNPSLPRNVKVKAEVNSFSIESESENGIFLFILFTPGHRRANTYSNRLSAQPVTRLPLLTGFTVYY